MKTGWKSVDRLLGGSLPQGKTILLSGKPGTLKTSFALQLLSRVGGRYLASEEHAWALAARADRMALDKSRVRVCATGSLPRALDSVTRNDEVVVLDSLNAFRPVSAEHEKLFVGLENATLMALQTIEFFRGRDTTVIMVVHTGADTERTENLVDAHFSMTRALGLVTLSTEKCRFAASRGRVSMRMTDHGLVEA